MVYSGSMSTEVFYRFHQNAAPCFCADHAWSAPWGSAFTPDGSQYECPSCGGTGVDYSAPICARCDGTGDDDDGYPCRRCGGSGEDVECHDCDGEGNRDCDPGYSCCWSPVELVDYFQRHAGGAPDDSHGEVVVFEGEHVGQGDDGEPLAIPTRVVDRLPWSEFAAKYLIRGEVGA